MMPVPNYVTIPLTLAGIFVAGYMFFKLSPDKTQEAIE